MPNITTHNQFAKDVFDKSKIEIIGTFSDKKNFYELFAQGFDPFFFGLAIFKKDNFSNYCHNNYTDTFFLNFIEIIKKKKLQKDPSILAALYGHLAHYVLDSTCHPFIVYKTGEYDKKKPETLKYNGKHTNMEMQIDAYIYEQKTNKKFKNFKIHKHLITKERFNKTLLSTLNEVYKKTFNIEKGGNKYQTGCRRMCLAYKYLIKDSTGIKTRIYQCIDKFTPKKYGVYEYFSSHITKIDFNIFNTNHKTWHNPWDKKRKSTESFFDLYNKALDLCIELLEATHKYLNNKISETEYKKVLKDNSYVTGFSWKMKNEMKYLEF